MGLDLKRLVVRVEPQLKDGRLARDLEANLLAGGRDRDKQRPIGAGL